MKIERKYVDMILDGIAIEDVVSKYVSPMKRSGRRLWACCPFHNEKTPSFCIVPDRNKWYCYGGCHESGNVISFYMKIENVPFPVAVKNLLRDYLHINLKDADMQSSPEDEEKEKMRQTMFIYNERVCKWFQDNLEADTKEAKAAKGYAYNRLGEEFCKESGIGFAPDSWSDLVMWATKTGLDLSILQKMGIVMMSEKTHSYYSFYRNRVMIPIRDRYNRVTGFTARTLDEHEEKGRKYLNSVKSPIYNKEYSVFGIDNAAKRARIEEKVYLVEGGLDAAKMQALGILNTVASLGGAWTKGQFEQLQKLKANICFIPDSDVPKEGEKFGAGFKNVMANGIAAIKMGFSVSVREIPCASDEKRDPGSYITSVNIFNSLNEEEFILWYARNTWDKDFLAEDKVKFIDSLCDILVCIKDESVQSTYINALVKKYHDRASWSNGLKNAKIRLQKEISRKNDKEAFDMLQEYGFTERGNCYYGTSKDGTQVKLSNCTLKPRFHVMHDIHPVRIFDLQNDEPDSKPIVIELDMDTLTSSKNLRKKLLGMGNYMWFGDDYALMKLVSYLAQNTETATEVKQMGWQRQGFYAFCNGVQEEGVWCPVDKMGIVRLKSGNYYIPAMSQLYENSTELYTNERRFIHLNYSNISLKDYLEKIVKVFGDNAKIGICFLLATLFRDIVKAKSHFFPILNIFGPKGSGKTQLAETLMTFFMNDIDSPNIESATLAALSDTVASASNAIVHLDEYKNSIDLKKVEWVKDLWGGIGRSKMNMDKDKKREQAKVDSGIVMTGQEMPTADIALFTRLIFMTYDKQHHTREERERYEDLLYYRKLGATHLTLEILNHRNSFEASFNDAWKKASSDVQERLQGEEILDRIEHNWVIPLAAYLALEKHLELPFTYEDLLDISIKGIKRQNSLCHSTDEVAVFWNIISSAQQKGTFKEGQDYIIRAKDTMQTSVFKDGIDFETPRQILMIRKNSMLATYRQLGKQMDEKLLPSESILHYLINTSEYMGSTCCPQRFKRYNSNGQPLQQYKTDSKGNVISARILWDRDRPLCFDYDIVSRKFGIILDSEAICDEETDKEETPNAEKGKSLDKEQTMFEDSDEPF